MEHSLTLWVPDVYNNDISMYMVVPCACILHVSNNVCMSLKYTVHIYDLLHKLSIADNYFSHIKKSAHVAYDLWDALVTVCVVLLKFEELYYYL